MTNTKLEGLKAEILYQREIGCNKTADLLAAELEKIPECWRSEDDE